MEKVGQPAPSSLGQPQAGLAEELSVEPDEQRVEGKRAGVESVEGLAVPKIGPPKENYGRPEDREPEPSLPPELGKSEEPDLKKKNQA
jgi:hypothetical protein